jgi:hypothetical protein
MTTGASGNRSAPSSIMIAVLAVALTLVGLIPGGQILQGLWLLALMLAVAGLALGFVGLTVARAGAGRLVASVVAMAANVALMGWLVVLAAKRF